MIEVLATLRDTPLPTILVVVGCVFLLLAVVNRIGAYIKISPKQQKSAGSIGGVLLALGIGLYLIPSQSPVVTADLSLTNTPVVPLTNIALPLVEEPTETPMPPITMPSILDTPIHLSTPQPTSTCFVGRPQPPNEHEREHAQIEDVHIQINKGEPIMVTRGDTITLNENDLLRLTQITYTSPMNLSVDDALAIEAYYLYDSCSEFYSLDGKSSTGVQLQSATQPQPLNDPILDNNKNPNPDWEVKQDWRQIEVVLIHYYPPGCDTCYAVEDRFRFQMIVLSSTTTP